MYQNRFCTKCGAELINGVCPNCKRVQPAAQYPQPDAQYQQQNYQYQQQPVVEVNPNDERFKSFFMNPKEKFICALGNGYLMNFLAGGFLGKGFAVVSDKRVYFKGKAFEIGEHKLKVKTVTSTVDLKDVTGTETRTNDPVGIWVLAFIMAILGVLMFLAGIIISYNTREYVLSNVLGYIGMCMFFGSIIPFCIYAKKRMTVLTIMFGGGGIAFPLKWYPAQEGEKFQKMLRIAKDQAVEEAENATANAMREALANTVVPQQPQASVSAADELAKYAQLYKDGMISEQEFADIKAKLLTKQ